MYDMQLRLDKYRCTHIGCTLYSVHSVQSVQSHCWCTDCAAAVGVGGGDQYLRRESLLHGWAHYDF